MEWMTAALLGLRVCGEGTVPRPGQCRVCQKTWACFFSSGILINGIHPFLCPFSHTLHVYSFICPSTHPPSRSSIHPFIHQTIHLPTHAFIYSSIYSCRHLSILWAIYSSFLPSIQLPPNLHIHLPIYPPSINTHLFLNPPTHPHPLLPIYPLIHPPFHPPVHPLVHSSIYKFTPLFVYHRHFLWSLLGYLDASSQE